MRKLKLQMQISIDGYGSTGPNDEQTWVTWAWEEIREHVLHLADTSDTILLGRKLAVDYIPYWQGVNQNPTDPMYEVGQRIDAMKKVVFSKTIKSDWNNTTIATNIDEVHKLKQQPGKDLIVYGGTNFVSNLIKENLIDEYHLFVNPVVLGKGESVFAELKKFKLINAATYPSGIVLLQYQPFLQGI